jgi:hypothetical protein
MDTVSLISDSIPKLYHLANSVNYHARLICYSHVVDGFLGVFLQAVENCFAFTDGLGFAGLLSALEVHLCPNRIGMC